MGKRDPRIAPAPVVVDDDFLQSIQRQAKVEPKLYTPPPLNKGWDANPKACLGKRWAVGQDQTELLDSKNVSLMLRDRYTKIELNMLHNTMSAGLPKRLGWFGGIGR